MDASYYPIEINFQAAGSFHNFPLNSGQTTNGVHNLQALFDRTRKGELLCVRGEGRLQRVEGLWAHLSYFWHRKAEQAAVKRVITATLNNYNRYLREKNEADVDRLAVQTLFCRIGGLSPRVLDRSHFCSNNKLSEIVLPDQTVRLKIGEEYIDYRCRSTDNANSKFIDLDLGDKESNVHLAMLLRRKRGEIFRVNMQGGLEKVTNRRLYRVERDVQEGRVQVVVTHVLNQLNMHLQRIEVTPMHKRVLKEIFTKSPLVRMKQKVYSREAIAEGSYLEHLLSEIFESQLLQKRDALKGALQFYRAAQDKVEAKAAIETKFMDLVLAEYNFSYHLGISLERVTDGGSGGARYARDRFGRKLLVVKPGDEGPHGVNNPQWYAKVKRWFVSPRSCLKGNSEPLSEVDAYLFDRRLGIYQVPPTEWRYIASRQFQGGEYKECSVQMFVEGCITMGEYVGISPKMHSLPRPLLRWYCGEEAGGGCLERLGTRREKREELVAKVPQRSAERVAAHDIGIENIDCHFENILVMIRDAEEESVVERLLGGKVVEDEEINEFVDHFFLQNHNQKLLQAILFSEKVTIGEEEKQVSFIKHDGGSSNPHKHPNGYLATRFKHLFEVLPNFEQPFSQEMIVLLENKERAFVEFLLEKGARALRNLHDPEGFKRYWDSMENRLHFKQWLLETNPDFELAARRTVIHDLLAASGKMSDRRGYEAYSAYFHSHLERIYGNIMTRIESWRLLQKHLRKNSPMRCALQIRNREDFTRELIGENATIALHLEEAKDRGVKRGGSHLEGNYFVGDRVLADLGEREYVVG